jgi:valyl-tRNA synthetase
MFGQMFDVAYPLVSPDGSTPSSGEHIVISTTRPETIPAETAIMIHPQDHRYTCLGCGAIKCTLAQQFL